MRAGMKEIRPEPGGRKYDGRIKQRNRAENTQNQRTSDCPAVSRFLPLVFYLSFSTFRFLSIALSLSGFNSDWKPSKN